MHRTHKRQEPEDRIKKNRNVIASDRRECGNLGIEIASPVFAEPALMKMGGGRLVTLRNDKRVEV